MIDIFSFKLRVMLILLMVQFQNQNFTTYELVISLTGLRHRRISNEGYEHSSGMTASSSNSYSDNEHQRNSMLLVFVIKSEHLTFPGLLSSALPICL